MLRQQVRSFSCLSSAPQASWQRPPSIRASSSKSSGLQLWQPVAVAFAAAGAAAATFRGGRQESYRWFHQKARCDDQVIASRPKIIAFGDSITQEGFYVGGWVQRIANVYVRRADVLNRGYSGYTTRWASPVLDKLLADGLGDGSILWTIWLGANDAAVPETSRHHVPLQEYEERLKTLVLKVQEQCPQASIIVVTPPAVEDDMYEPGDRKDAQAALYAAAARRVAADCGVFLLDVYTVMHSQPQPPRHFLSDGLHLSEAGGQLVAKMLMDLIAEQLPWLAVTPDRFTGKFHNSGSASKLRKEFPWHDELSKTVPYHSSLK